MGEEMIKLKCHDKYERQLPSFQVHLRTLTLNDTDGNINYITIVGGGYGHGVGESIWDLWPNPPWEKLYRNHGTLLSRMPA